VPAPLSHLPSMHEPKQSASLPHVVDVQVEDEVSHRSSAGQSPSVVHVRSLQAPAEHASNSGQSASLAQPRQASVTESWQATGPHVPEQPEPQGLSHRGSVNVAPHVCMRPEQSLSFSQQLQLSAGHELGRCAVWIAAQPMNVTEPHGHAGHISGAQPGVC
jgi:hypothetical protein